MKCARMRTGGGVVGHVDDAAAVSHQLSVVEGSNSYGHFH